MKSHKEMTFGVDFKQWTYCLLGEQMRKRVGSEHGFEESVVCVQGMETLLFGLIEG